MRPVLFLIFLFSCSLSFAGKKEPKDSNYVQYYPDRFIFSLRQNYRYYEVDITQKQLLDPNGISKIDYLARGNNSTGFGIDLDKISFAIGFRSPISEEEIARKGTTSTFNLSAALNLNKTRVEVSYRKYQGFFDENTGKYPDFTDSSAFFQNSGMYSTEMRLKTIYFRDKKNRFSYAAAYANTQRQIKSKATLIYVGNIYYYGLAGSRSHIPNEVDTFYGQWHDINSLEGLGLSAGPGFSANIVVFKKLILNATFSFGLDLQFRDYGTLDGRSHQEFKLGFASAESRFSLGYNGERFFVFGYTMTDLNTYKLGWSTFETRLISGGLKLGYRFDASGWKWYQWMKRTKLYQLL